NLTVAGAAGLTVIGAGTLSATSSGTVTLTAGTTSEVNATQSTFLGSVASTAQNINIRSANSFTAGNMTGTNGNISISVNTGSLNVAPNALLSTPISAAIQGVEGNITLFNANAASGTINFGAGSQVLTNNTSIGNLPGGILTVAIGGFT